MSQAMLSPAAETAPRYTSYPTAPHFHAGVDAAVAREWLLAVPDGEKLSLYVHIPFCDKLCWFCACHTKQTLRYEPVAAYLALLRREIAIVGAATAGRATVAALHFGGGSPTMLRPDDLYALMTAFREAFTFEPDASISVEIDPNDMDEARLDALAGMGMNRASLGIQDFDPAVQKAINRQQSFELTRAVVEGLRRRGVGSINLDVLYGLPFQTVAGVEATLDKVLSLSPDRIALFGYAHVPWFKKHQTMIDEASLPDTQERLRQSLAAAGLIVGAGYQAIGLDHFALPGDSLARAARQGRLRRNFQGYTDDGAQTLIGLGPSSVSRYRQGFTQNVAAVGDYGRMLDAGGLTVGRGVALSDDDLLRGWVIERLMCDFRFSSREAVAQFGPAANAVLSEAVMLTQEREPMLARDGDMFAVPPDRRPLVRLVASRFDAYLGKGGARHSVAV